MRRGVSVQRALAGVAVVLVAIAAGVGAYFWGRSGGADLAAARAHGQRAGLSIGYAAGIQRGYRAGFSTSRRQSYARAYNRAYVAGYRRAYVADGLAPPERVSVPGQR